jgi:hypothetical protein
MATSDNITILSDSVYFIHAFFWITEVQSGLSMKEGDTPTNEKDVNQNPLQQLVDYNKLFFSVFSVLQKLGADDRPEVCLLCMAIHGLLTYLLSSLFFDMYNTPEFMQSFCLFQGSELSSSDSVSDSLYSWAKTFSNYVGGLPLDICFPNVRTCFPLGKYCRIA